jgi:deoxyribose-phosphate aldolase
MVIEFVEKYKALHFYGFAFDLNYLASVKKHLIGTNIRLSGVASYPLGCQTNATKIKQIEYSISAGADEVDVSMNYNAIKSGDFKRVKEETMEMMDKVGDKIDIIAIPQTSILTTSEALSVYKILLECGIDKIKLNSGFGWNSIPEDVILVKRVFGDSFKRIDVSGGVRTLEQLNNYIELGADYIHSSTPDNILSEIK